MCKEAPGHIVNEAAQKCIDANACKYTYFKRAFHSLMNERIHAADSGNHLPAHQNIRGRDCYQ